MTWDWDFGDGSDHSTANPVDPGYVYADEGTYIATVTATYGGVEAQDTVTVDVAVPLGGGAEASQLHRPKMVTTCGT